MTNIVKNSDIKIYIKSISKIIKIVVFLEKSIIFAMLICRDNCGCKCWSKKNNIF
jgi:hypothetical protein